MELLFPEGKHRRNGCCWRGEGDGEEKLSGFGHPAGDASGQINVGLEIICSC